MLVPLVVLLPVPEEEDEDFEDDDFDEDEDVDDDEDDVADGDDVEDDDAVEDGLLALISDSRILSLS